MSLDFKSTLADSLLDLCQEKPLKDISVTDLIEKTSIGRQTFYNHFQNKNDLIQYIYRSRIAFRPDPVNPPADYYESTLYYYSAMQKHKNFMSQACRLEGDGNLRDYMYEFALGWYDGYFRYYWGMKRVPPEIEFAVRYNAYATSGTTIRWIRSGMKDSAEMISLYRAECLSSVMSPYLPCQSKPDLPKTGLSPALKKGPVRKMQPKHVNSLPDDPVKSRYSDALLTLCKEKPLTKVTIRELLAATSTGRQTFYHHFQDKADLIHWTFYNKILYLSPDGSDFYNGWIKYFEQLYEYRNFMAQACAMEEQNSLRDYMVSCTVGWYENQYSKYFAGQDMPEIILFAIDFHAYGITGLILDWVQNKFSFPPEQMTTWVRDCQPPPLRIYPFVGHSIF